MLRVHRRNKRLVACSTRMGGRSSAPEEEPWIAKPRDALRAQFVRTLLRLGESLERRRDWKTAIELYRRGLEADNLAESLYRGLMRALAATGNHAEAINAFRPCRQRAHQ